MEINKELIEWAKVLLPQTKEGNDMLKAIIERGKQMGREQMKEACLKEELGFLESLSFGNIVKRTFGGEDKITFKYIEKRIKELKKRIIE